MTHQIQWQRGGFLSTKGRISAGRDVRPEPWRRIIWEFLKSWRIPSRHLQVVSSLNQVIHDPWMGVPPWRLGNLHLGSWFRPSLFFQTSECRFRKHDQLFFLSQKITGSVWVNRKPWYITSDMAVSCILSHQKIPGVRGPMELGVYRRDRIVPFLGVTCFILWKIPLFIVVECGNPTVNSLLTIA